MIWDIFKKQTCDTSVTKLVEQSTDTTRKFIQEFGKPKDLDDLDKAIKDMVKATGEHIRGGQK